MSGLQSPQPGQWWVMDGPPEQHHEGWILFCIGKDSKGYLRFEDCEGNVEVWADPPCEYHIEHACTGFDWKPETFPQWLIPTKPVASEQLKKPIAFYRRDSKHSGETFHTDGSSFKWGNWEQMDDIRVITEAEALALLTPQESPEDWVTQDRVPERPGVDEWRMVSGANASVWIRSANSQSYQNRHGDKVGDSICEVRCRRKDLPQLVESTDNFIELTDPDEVLQPDDEVTAIENISDDDDRDVALQCPLDDNRYGWCTVESLRGLTGAKVRDKKEIFVMRRPIRREQAKPAMEKITLKTIVFWDKADSKYCELVSSDKQLHEIADIWKFCHVVDERVVEVPVT